MLRLQRDSLQLVASHSVDLIKTSKTAIQKGEVRVDQIPHAEVFINQRLQKCVRLVEHRLLHQNVEIAVKPRVRFGKIDQAEIEPFSRKVSNEILPAVVRQHSFNLMLNGP